MSKPNSRNLTSFGQLLGTPSPRLQTSSVHCIVPHTTNFDSSTVVDMNQMMGHAYLYGGDIAAVAGEEAALVEDHRVNFTKLGLGRQQPLRLEFCVVLFEQNGDRASYT